MRQGIEVELGGVKDRRVRFEGDFRSAPFGMPRLLQRLGRLAATVGLLVDLLVFPDLQFQLFRKSVDAGNAHTVQAARNFVAVAVKLSAGVQLRHHHLRSRLLLALVVVNGNPAAIVDDRDGIVAMDNHIHTGTMSGQRFVDGIVNNFVDEVVQSHLTGGSDVHCRAFADRFEPFQNFDA